MEVCVGVFGILEGPSQGRKNSRSSGEEKRRGSIKDGGEGIVSNDVFVLRVGEASSDERQVEEIPIILMIANRSNEIRDGSEKGVPCCGGNF